MKQLTRIKLLIIHNHTSHIIHHFLHKTIEIGPKLSQKTLFLHFDHNISFFDHSATYAPPYHQEKNATKHWPHIKLSLLWRYG